ncbi:hypothetical protein SKAU_G00173600 [Synaphobranchus kaupii]|uniref:Uncharacterized protein n=1 Tax=Synaphobranchus kaupii TaxID=118154 RepID=A0A9Q1FKW6_SYNKA|nr:hypothetical protein SKAU_G00173600 [Synaphobranchus kaupii]
MWSFIQQHSEINSKHTPCPGEVVVDVRTTQAPASPLDLPEAEGLTSDQQQRFQELIHQWAGVFAAQEEDFSIDDIPTE